MAINHEDRCIGALLGTAVGDILGANVEFKSRLEIANAYGRVTDFLDSPQRPLGMFTDDTEMTVALAQSLVDCGKVDDAHCAASYARLAHEQPRRGYGPATTKILRMLADGVDYRSTGRAIHPEGSYANGGAMRIAPVGLAYRNANRIIRSRVVEDALLCTHVHPEATDAAIVQADAIAVLCRTEPDVLNINDFLDGMRLAATEETVYDKVCAVIDGLDYWCTDSEFLNSVCTPNEYGKAFQIRASEAVACALWAFAHHPQDPEEAVIRAVSLGGDTDTVGAMTGALCGALHGWKWIPQRWFEKVENGPGIGRDYIIELAKELATLDLIA